MRQAWLLACALAVAPYAHAQDLSFNDAVARASAEGPTITAGNDAVIAARRERRAAGRLPDPQLVLGLDNVPVDGPDRYRLNRDEMTMQRVGIMQEMPNGAGLSAQRAVANAQIERANASLEVVQLEARLGAADAWIRLYFAQKRVAVLQRLATDARASADAARARLGAGGAGVDDALAAEVESARAIDRQSEAEATVVAARADLRRWIGAAADQSLAASAPTFAIDPTHLRDHIEHHPALAAFDAEHDAAAANLQAARAGRLPDWSWELSYGRRAPELSDMASVEVRIGLPLFQPWRQGPIVDARRADLNRTDAERDAAVREHGAMLDAQLAQYHALSANLERARQTRLPLARQRAEAATQSYAAGTQNITVLIAARGQALEAELDVIELEERVASLGAAMTLQYAEQGQ